MTLTNTTETNRNYHGLQMGKKLRDATDGQSTVQLCQTNGGVMQKFALQNQILMVQGIYLLGASTDGVVT
jgi:hypothetical protein